MWSLLRTANWPTAPAGIAILLAAGPAAAQSVERFTIDSVVQHRYIRRRQRSSRPQVVVDISSAMRIADHWQIVFRPWFRQLRPPGAGR